jgi:hypothetical protein
MSYFLLGDFLSANTPTAAGFATDAPAANIADQRPQVYGAAAVSDADSRWEVATGVNDVVAFDEGGGALYAVLTPGAHTFTSLAADIKTQMEAVGGLTYTIARTSTTGIVTIVASASMTLLWADGTSGVDGCADMLGFDPFNTSSAGAHFADEARWSNALSLVYDVGSVKVRPCCIALTSDADKGADFDGLRVFGSNTNHGGLVESWITAGAEEFVLSDQLDAGDAGLRAWFGALSGGTAYQYYLIHWQFTDTSPTHAIGLARMWSQSAPVYDSTTGRLVQADAKSSLQYLGGSGSAGAAWQPAGMHAWGWSLNFKQWPISAWESVFLAVQRWGSDRPVLWVADLLEQVAGNTTTWETAIGRGLVLWAFASAADATAGGALTIYRSGAVSLEQCR